jgi:asparagine synthase (glutamine-hydrolysing)
VHPTRPELQDRLAAGLPHLASLIAPEFTGVPLQLRFPLLDTRVIRFVVNAPAVPWCQNKHLAREAYRHRLPDAVLRRPKTGVGGLHERLVRSWQQRDQALPPRSSDVWRWADPDACRAALEGLDPATVGDAWRVLQLHAWLAPRHGAEPMRAAACTA